MHLNHHSADYSIKTRAMKTIISLLLCGLILATETETSFPRLHYGFPLQGQPIRMGPSKTSQSNLDDVCNGFRCGRGKICVSVSGKLVCRCRPCPAFKDQPVCGSDHNTYPGLCELNYQSCVNNLKVTAVNYGYCRNQTTEFGSSLADGDKNCDGVCPRIFKPVCGSDGKTYSNKCLLDIATCEADGSVIMVHKGKCKIDCEKKCPRILKRVCGSDGKTYSNECELDIAACKSYKRVVQVGRGKCGSNKDFGVKSR